MPDNESPRMARKLSGLPRILAATFAISLTLITFYTAFYGLFLPMVQRSIYLCLLMTVIYLWVPATKKSPRNRPSVIDYVCCATCLVILAWTLYSSSRFLTRIPFYGRMLPMDTFAGLALVALVLEAGRRTLGMSIVIIAASFIAYAFAGPWMPNLFAHPGMSIKRFIDIIYLTDMGLWSSLVGISATLLFVFISFGVFLQGTRVDRHYVDLCLAVAGGKPGGPAKVAVLGSAVMGSMSGSSIANVMTTGPITIPLMKKTGYSPEEAGAIEAVASSGGQILPPIMGTGAFIMADFLGIRYFDIVKVSVLPAILFYLTLWVFVDKKALKRNIVGVPVDELPSAKSVFLKYGYLFSPIIILFALLFYGYTPYLAGAACCVLTIVVSMIKKETRLSIRDFLMTLENCAISVSRIAGVIACAAIIVAMINYTGLMIKSTSIILYVSRGDLTLTLIIVAFISFVIGLGLSVATAYVILATLAAPALMQLGIPGMSAHLMLFWFSQVAQISPPVCLTAFAAASISGASPMKTGFAALSMGATFYFIPVLFIFSNLLAVENNLLGALADSALALAAITCYASGLEGNLWGKNIGKLQRIVCFIAAALFFISTFNTFDSVSLKAVFITIAAIGVILPRLTSSKTAQC